MTNQEKLEALAKAYFRATRYRTGRRNLVTPWRADRLLQAINRRALFN